MTTHLSTIRGRRVLIDRAPHHCGYCGEAGHNRVGCTALPARERLALRGRRIGDTRRFWAAIRKVCAGLDRRELWQRALEARGSYRP
jgi:hypothetical protein